MNLLFASFLLVFLEYSLSFRVDHFHLKRKYRVVDYGTCFSGLSLPLFRHRKKFQNDILQYSPSSELQPNERLVKADLTGEMKNAFLSYAMSTILSRALPDVRDGLKPVHRRVLFAMYSLGLSPDASYRKCARIVGEVLGKFHPHGDTSVYDALVRMTQDFVMRHPLISGHGNFGSVDADPPAAMRYTEAKLASIAQDALLNDLKDDTVDFSGNFDDSELEPNVFPARIPLLLINGASGIAVGMATNIPPHNLAEVIDATVAIINNPNLSEEELSTILPGPDFPTGGQIVDVCGCLDMAQKGQGSITIRASYHFEILSASGKTIEKLNSFSCIESSLTKHRKSNSSVKKNGEKRAIIVTQLPYQTNKAQLMHSLAEAVNDKRIEGISDLRDESDRDGMRIVIEIKRDSLPEVVIQHLLQRTPLQSTFSANLLALVPSAQHQNNNFPPNISFPGHNDQQRPMQLQPRRLTVRQLLQEFIQFRFATLRRRSYYRLLKAQTRYHIVVGLQRALQHVDMVVEIIRNSSDAGEAKRLLMSVSGPFQFSEQQAESVLSLTLKRLTSLEADKLFSEAEDLQRDVCYLERLISEDNLIFDEMVTEMMEVKRLHGSPRKTLINRGETPDQSKLDSKENNSLGGEIKSLQQVRFLDSAMRQRRLLVPNEQCVLLFSSLGYIKRLAQSEFSLQSRGGRGRNGRTMPSLHRENDSTVFYGDSSFVHYKALNGNKDQRDYNAASVSQVPLSMFVVSHKAHDMLLCMSDAGRLYRLAALDFPLTSLSSSSISSVRGLPLPQLLPLQRGERITSIIPISDEDITSSECIYLVTMTQNGFLKKTSLLEFLNRPRRAGLQLQSLEEGDRVLWMHISHCSGNQKEQTADLTTEYNEYSSEGVRQSSHIVSEEVWVASRQGFVCRFDSRELRVSKRGGKGVKAISLRPNDTVACLDISSNGNSSDTTDRDLLVVTKRGYGKRVSVSEFRRLRRGRNGLRATRFKSIKGLSPAQQDSLVSIKVLLATGVNDVCNTTFSTSLVSQQHIINQELLLSTAKGAILRVLATQVAKQSRGASGVKLQQVASDDEVTSCELIFTHKEGGNENVIF